jgi:hypothetical protein
MILGGTKESRKEILDINLNNWLWDILAEQSKNTCRSIGIGFARLKRHSDHDRADGSGADAMNSAMHFPNKAETKIIFSSFWSKKLLYSLVLLRNTASSLRQR